MKFASLICAVLVTTPSARTLAEAAPHAAVVLVHREAKTLHEIIKPESQADFSVVYDYLNRVEKGSNWTETMAKPSTEFPDLVRPLHEVMQFFFAGKKDFDEKTRHVLVDLPRRLSFIENVLSPEELDQVAEGNARLAAAWFRLAAESDPKEFLKNDPWMISPTTCMEFVREMRKPFMVKVLTTNDLNAMMNCLAVWPDFSREYLSNLVFIHTARFPGKGVRNLPRTFGDRLDIYEGACRPFGEEPAWTYATLWREKPAIFESRVAALSAWIDLQLTSIAEVSDAIRGLKSGKEKTAGQFAVGLGNVMSPLFNVQTAQPGQPRVATALTTEQTNFLKELNRYLRIIQKPFTVENASLEPLMRTLKQGDSQTALDSGLLRYTIDNLQGPVLILSNYAGRHPTREVLENIALLRSRFKELQLAAEALESGKTLQ